jgi:hypothetical protein
VGRQVKNVRLVANTNWNAINAAGMELNSEGANNHGPSSHSDTAF